MEYAPPANPNLYTLFSQLLPEAGWFTCLDLKDAFFCIRLCHQHRVPNLWALLSHLAEMGYRVSWKKAQLCRKQVQYLGFVISKGQRALSTERKKVITSLPHPPNRRALRQRLIIKVAHLVITLMNSQGLRWLSNARLTQYQGLLLENPRISLETVHALNPATFLPTEEGDPEHDCIEVISEVYATRPNLQDSPHPNPDPILYTDGSRFLRDRKRHGWYPVTTTDEVLQAGALPSGWSAQWSEPWALIRALTLSEGRKVNIYTDSRYAFATVHVHGAIYKERGLLTMEGKTIKNKQEILKLLQAIWLPQQVAVIHCWSHQRGNESSAVRNRVAVTKAKSMAMGSPSELLLVTDTTTTSLPRYTKEELRWAKSEGATRLPQGWWQLPDGRLFIPALK
ncbi:hypothetical protein mRhiFer1_009406 [Rhinolophus ferrumequinum]|uniref:RNase H type-1 domain-containing protein n=1 Tax=Rhinolophus ferrumequinum TaxID=59479 RepID=A0A7J7RPM3_RHIFE|nr:hypothetical protein mRhiFer1_009406 [Rhinolophus ferrumequinum]